MPFQNVTSAMRKISRLLPIAFALACLPTVAGAAPAGPNSGSFRMDKIKTTFAHGCGYRMAGDNGPRRVLVLSSVAMDCAAADTGFDPYEELKVKLEEAKADYVVLYVSDDGTTIQNGHWIANDPSDAFSFGGQGKAEIKRADQTRVEGHYFMEKPDSFFDKTYEFDLRFALDLRGGSLEGTSLPGGGAPGKAYQSYVAAMAKNDGKALRKLVPAERDFRLPERRRVRHHDAQRHPAEDRQDLERSAEGRSRDARSDRLELRRPQGPRPCAHGAGRRGVEGRGDADQPGVLTWIGRNVSAIRTAGGRGSPPAPQLIGKDRQGARCLVLFRLISTVPLPHRHQTH